MNRQQFIDQFVTQFLASWCAKNHGDYCARNLHESLYNPPIEDAQDIAEEIWERHYVDSGCAGSWEPVK